MTEPTTHTLNMPGAVLHYDVRSHRASGEPTLLLFGSPIEAAAFTALAGHFTDRTVVTHDPRGAGRSKRTDGAPQTSVEEHVADLHQLITQVSRDPVDVFATSGGAMNALALVARHPDQVRIMVAHEPPAAQELPDRAAVLAACDAIKQTYLREGYGPGMAKFIALVSLLGPIPAGFADQPAPDPATFGLPTVDDGTREDALLCLNMPSCPAYRLDFTALLAAPTRIVVAIGAESGDALPGRGATAVAARLGTTPVVFPGGHTGFRATGPGSKSEADQFATTLRRVLAG